MVSTCIMLIAHRMVQLAKPDSYESRWKGERRKWYWVAYPASGGLSSILESSSLRESAFDAIDRYNFDDHKIVRVGRLVTRMGPRGGLSVSPDGRWALVPNQINQSDLMMVNDFK